MVPKGRSRTVQQGWGQDRCLHPQHCMVPDLMDRQPCVCVSYTESVPVCWEKQKESLGTVKPGLSVAIATQTRDFVSAYSLLFWLPNSPALRFLLLTPNSKPLFSFC